MVCKNILSFAIAVCITAGVAQGQQKKPVPPPPKPADEGPSVEATAKSLEKQLNSIGRVSWSQTTQNTKTNEVTGPAQAWEEVSRLNIIPRTCEMRVEWKSSAREEEGGGTFFIEEMDSIAVQGAVAHTNLIHPGAVYTMSPEPYSVVVNGGMDFKVRDQQTANQIATALRQLVQRCKVNPPVANSGPSLEETLSFIEDRLNQQGAVTWLSTVQNTVAGTSNSPVQISLQLSRVTGDVGSCRVKFHSKSVIGSAVSDFDYMLPLRRIERLAVMSLQDGNNGFHARQGHPEMVETISPPTISELEITGGANRTWYLVFSDEELANRVAKALTHAVELCGGGNKDPF
jgi:hypothetical protein